MKRLLASIALMAASIVCAGPAPYTLTVNSRAQTAPPVIAYAGNETVYRVSYTDGDTASAIAAGEIPFFAWATNNAAAVNSTSSYAIVAGYTGVVDFTFSPAAVNFAAGRYIYETGVKASNGNNRVYRQGTFQIYGSPVGSGVAAVTWTTNMNWAAINWQNLPTWLSTPVFNALSTNRVNLLHDSQDADVFQTVENGTGTVWRISVVTNYDVTLSEDFLDTATSTRPAWTNNAFPFYEPPWQGTLTSIAGPNGEWVKLSEVYPITFYADSGGAQGTAVVSQLVTHVTNAISTYATAARVAAVEADVAAIALTTNQVTLNPYVKTLYGDLATTNTAGYAGFLTTNAAEKAIVAQDPVISQSLGKFRYDFSCRTYGAVAFSGYVQSAAAGETNLQAFATVCNYSQAGVLLSCATGATVNIGSSAYSNLTASASFPYAATNGYAVAELFCATNTTRDARVVSGGSYPATLAINVRPLNYATIAEVDATVDGHVTGGTHTNVTLAGTVTIGGVSRTDWPAGTPGAITNGQGGFTVYTPSSFTGAEIRESGANAGRIKMGVINMGPYSLSGIWANTADTNAATAAFAQDSSANVYFSAPSAAATVYFGFAGSYWPMSMTTTKLTLAIPMEGTSASFSTFLKLTPTADPPSAAEGVIYADTDHHLYYYDGSNWKQLDN